mgnify:CR=1 FL=1
MKTSLPRWTCGFLAALLLLLGLMVLLMYNDIVRIIRR